MDKTCIDKLIAKGWTRAVPENHPLGLLDGRCLENYKLIVLLGRKSRVGAECFHIFLQNSHGETSLQPVVTGLFNRGQYPGYNWVEIMHLAQDSYFGKEKKLPDTRKNRIAECLVHCLADIIPPGGHLMIEYDSPEHYDTAQSLALGIPAIATPLGYLMFQAGCGAGIKDWYFSEGGNEGPRKLQGFKALDTQHDRIQSGKVVKELTRYLESMPQGASELERAARYRAVDIVDKLQTGNIQ